MSVSRTVSEIQRQIVQRPWNVG